MNYQNRWGESGYLLLCEPLVVQFPRGVCVAFAAQVVRIMFLGMASRLS